jgi:transposase
MATEYSDAEILEAYKTYKEAGSYRAAAQILGIDREVVTKRVKQFEEKRGSLDKADHYEIPHLPTEEMPTEELIERMTRGFERKKKAKQARKWINVKVDTDKPIGLAFLGDPHIDDSGCDWATLRRDLDIIKNTPGMRGCSLGDEINNWVGRLSRLYSEQETTAAQAWQLVEWLIEEMDPLLLIAGNHDMWSGSGDPVQWMKGPHHLYEKWSARVQLQFKNGVECRIHMAHDMPGHSQWNPLHAQMKAAKFWSTAHLYIAGHRHNWALAQVELPEIDTCPWLARARGYKFFDDYALTKGYDEQQYGHAIGAVIDPQAKTPATLVTCFADLEETAEYLTWKREKYARAA